MTPQKWGVIFNYIFPKTLLIRLAVKARPEGYGVTYLIWYKKER